MSDIESELLSFLRGSQISESMSSSLRKEIYLNREIDTKSKFTLEELLLSELKKGRSLIVAGSAGGGKTMLIDYLQSQLSETGMQLEESQVVTDLTAVEGDRAKFLEKIISRGQYIIAANEGILRDPRIQEVLPEAWTTLRDLQRGKHENSTESPILVDIAGIDPIMSSLTQLFLKESLRNAVKLSERSCKMNHPDIPCVRIESLSLLDEKMAAGMTALITDSIGPGEITYRELWNFVRDVFLGGSCENPIMENAWFWRIFYGRTNMSARIRNHLRPNLISMPDLTPFLYRGDWERIQINVFGAEYKFIHPGQAPIDMSDPKLRIEVLTWLKIQCALVLRTTNPRYPRFLGETSGGLEKRILSQNKLNLLMQLVNAYFRREDWKIQKSSLELWIDMATERRLRRASSLIGLGEFPKRELEITRSQVIGNISDVSIDGSRAYLSSKNKFEEPLELNSSLFDALLEGRPQSTARKKYDDIDYSLRRFFLELYDSNKVEDPELISLLTPGSSSNMVEFSWRIARDLPIERIEP